MRMKTFLAFTLAGTLAIGTSVSVHADYLDDLEQEQQYYEQESAWTEQQLNDIYGELDSLQEQKNTLIGQISETDAQLVMTLATIDTLNTQIEEKTAELDQTTAALGVAEDNEAKEYEAMKKRIQYLYENGGNGGWATILLEDRDITDMLNQAEYTQKMYDYDRDCLNLYAGIVSQVSDLKAQQEQEKYDLELMKANMEEQQAHLEGMLGEMQIQNSDYDNQISYANEVAAEYSYLLNQQNAKIQELVAAQEAERERIAAEEAARAAAEAAAAEAAAAEAAAAAAAAEEESSGGSYDDGGSSGGSSYSEPAYDAATGNAVVDRAYAWLGRAEYVWGGCSPGAFDCSGFVSYCLTGSYTRIGVAASFMAGITPRANPQPGDVCASSHHCGIYIGGGQMIHCSTYGVGVIIGPVQSDMIVGAY